MSASVHARVWRKRNVCPGISRRRSGSSVSLGAVVGAPGQHECGKDGPGPCKRAASKMFENENQRASLIVRAPPGVPCEVPACHATLTEHAQWITRVESMLEPHANGVEGAGPCKRAAS